LALGSEVRRVAQNQLPPELIHAERILSRSKEEFLRRALNPQHGIPPWSTAQKARAPSSQVNFH
jgi:hypothetical protein